MSGEASEDILLHLKLSCPPELRRSLMSYFCLDWAAPLAGSGRILRPIKPTADQKNMLYNFRSLCLKSPLGGPWIHSKVQETRFGKTTKKTLFTLKWNYYSGSRSKKKDPEHTSAFPG